MSNFIEQLLCHILCSQGGYGYNFLICNILAKLKTGQIFYHLLYQQPPQRINFPVAKKILPVSFLI
jgi:hypothetical protein